MSRAQLTSTVEQNTGGAVAPLVAGKNAIINGGMEIWQRGTSFTNGNASYTYSADRWQMYSGTPTGRTWSRQATGDTTNLPNIQYCMRVARDSGNTATNDLSIIQTFETVNAVPYAGKTVTVSYYARKGANYSATSSNLNIRFWTGTGTDQNNFIAGYTGLVTAIDANDVLTSTWTRYTRTVTLQSSVTEFQLAFTFVPTGTAGAADYFEITGLQIEAGAVATPFSRCGATLQGELALCQRYYYRVGGSNTNETFGVGLNKQSTTNLVIVNLPVQMRVAPTSLDFANLQISDNYTYGTSITACALFNNGNSKDSPLVEGTVSGGLTTGQMSFIRSAATTNGYLGFSAEL